MPEILEIKDKYADTGAFTDDRCVLQFTSHPDTDWVFFRMFRSGVMDQNLFISMEDAIQLRNFLTEAIDVRGQD